MTPCDPCAMPTFAVLEERFGAWDWSRDLRDQDGFADHAAIMNALVDDGFIVLGGPVGEASMCCSSLTPTMPPASTRASRSTRGSASA
jgi:hypothetical protein